MMIGKRMQRIISGFMCLVLILSMLSILPISPTSTSSFISTAYGWDPSAGGDGDFGDVGSGKLV